MWYNEEDDNETEESVMTDESQSEWSQLTPEEKRKQLFLNQKELLLTFLEKHAISQQQFDKSFGDLCKKMGFGPTDL